MYLFTAGYEDNRKFVVPTDNNYSLREIVSVKGDNKLAFV